MKEVQRHEEESRSGVSLRYTAATGGEGRGVAGGCGGWAVGVGHRGEVSSSPKNLGRNELISAPLCTQ